MTSKRDLTKLLSSKITLRENSEPFRKNSSKKVKKITGTNCILITIERMKSSRKQDLIGILSCKKNFSKIKSRRKKIYFKRGQRLKMNIWL